MNNTNWRDVFINICLAELAILLLLFNVAALISIITGD